ncbi:hypothetical protein ACT17_14620 [Mycolicibacterium conceptionense]|uniref:Uncharacterized protein n=1 Tax=Mycolicibacterium conceptionense TaxID=451644 RepID=A0A0J8WWY4_9MYCO|nr:hypothetical protein [Mycolicibacterium conceptionense]KMV17529.1 hypothetical protein ACT17_14620 [Mycolicibacterium conceptionense]
MSGRLNYRPYDVTDASVSVYSPSNPYYRNDVEELDVDPDEGLTVVGIGPDYPDAVLIGSRDELIRVFREALGKLGA